MGYSRLETPYAGGAQVFPLDFSLGYLDPADITVFVEGDLDGFGVQITRAFTFIDATNVSVTDALPNPCTVIVERTVNKDQLVVATTASGDFTRDTLVLGFKQLMMNIHELLDGRVDQFTDIALIQSLAADVVAASIAADDDAAAAAASAVAANLSAITAADVASGADLTAVLQKSANLTDVVDKAAARVALELGSAAQSATGDFATAAQGTRADAVHPAGLSTGDLLQYGGSAWQRLPKGAKFQQLSMKADASGSEWSAGIAAWVNFNGTGTPSLRASKNVSSITDRGTGLFTINFVVALPDTLYSGFVNCAVGGPTNNNRGGNVIPLNTTSAYVNTFGGGTASDEIITDVLIIR